MLLLIIGTASSGKTNLAKTLQSHLEGYWHYMSLDSTFAGMPDQYGGGLNGPLSYEGFRYENKDLNASITCGPVGRQVLQGMVVGATAMLRSGINVIFDDMLIDEYHAGLWRVALSDVNNVVIRLTANESILLERDEPRPRPSGLALNHIESNNLLPADLVFDTGKCTNNEIVESILARLNNVKDRQS